MGTKSFSKKEWEADQPTKESRIALVLAKICSIKEVGIIPWKKKEVDIILVPTLHISIYTIPTIKLVSIFL